ncbi:MAG TPA: phosphate signaling complex protein PhoU [Pelomicrobium sp.]|nr:phosphate signaling complex protein PhoU [Pelomicrobium sp.]
MSILLEGHTVRRFDGELNQVHLSVLELGGLALDQWRVALEALKADNLDAARRVVAREDEVDGLQVALDARILALISRRAPVARDLRAVLALSKCVADLERIGDLAAKVGHFVVDVHEGRERRLPPVMVHDVFAMGRVVLAIVDDALLALDDFDRAVAEEVVRRHTDLDRLFRGCVRRITTVVLETPRLVGGAVAAVLLVKAVERAGDHARNVADCLLRFNRDEVEEPSPAP